MSPWRVERILVSLLNYGVSFQVKVTKAYGRECCSTLGLGALGFCSADLFPGAPLEGSTGSQASQLPSLRRELWFSTQPFPLSLSLNNYSTKSNILRAEGKSIMDMQKDLNG